MAGYAEDVLAPVMIKKG
jgi:PAS domain S-box-containing protein